MPFATESRIALYFDHLVETLTTFEINTPARIAAFLAQIAHESGSMKYVIELADGKAYEGRKSLGNTQPGDGPKYKGRGLIQITGRNNYTELSKDLEYDFVFHPQDLANPRPACLSAGWFWKRANLNPLADVVTVESFKKITKKINGGYNGLDDRLKHWERCRTALGVVLK